MVTLAANSGSTINVSIPEGLPGVNGSIGVDKIYTLISSQLPQFIVSEFEKFNGHEQSIITDFLEAYYEWLESRYYYRLNPSDTDEEYKEHIGPLYTLKRIAHIKDVDETLPEFIDELRKEVMIHIPKNTAVDERLLIKKIKEFYQAKGTEKSFQFLFRILFNKEASIYYPGFFKLSESRWNIDKSIKVIPADTSTTYSQIKSFEKKKIIGLTSNTTAVVEKVIQYQNYNNTISELLLNNDSISGTFSNTENVRAYASGSSGDYASGIVTITPVVVSATVNSRPLSYYSNNILSALSTTNLSSYILFPGIHYEENSNISLNGLNGGHGAEIYIKKVSSGGLDEIYISNGGSGYNSYNTITLSGDKIQIIPDYLVLENYNGSFVVGETLRGVCSNTTANIRFFDSSNNKVWVNDIRGDFQTVHDTQWKDEFGEIVIGETSNTTCIISSVHKGDDSAFAYINSVNTTGAITGITIKNRGYNFKFPPYIEVISTTGTGARLLAVGLQIGRILSLDIQTPGYGSVKGFGWNYNTDFNFSLPERHIYFDQYINHFKNDALNEIVIDSDGWRFNRFALPSNLSQTFWDTQISFFEYANFSGMGSATVGALNTYKGCYRNDDHLLGGRNGIIQDGEYYQPYSYVIKVEKELNHWKNAIINLVHPAGMKFFAEYPVAIFSNNDTTLDTSNISTRSFYDKKIGFFTSEDPSTYGESASSIGTNDGISDYIQKSNAFTKLNLTIIGKFEDIKMSEIFESSV